MMPSTGSMMPSHTAGERQRSGRGAGGVLPCPQAAPSTPQPRRALLPSARALLGSASSDRKAEEHSGARTAATFKPVTKPPSERPDGSLGKGCGAAVLPRLPCSRGNAGQHAPRLPRQDGSSQDPAISLSRPGEDALQKQDALSSCCCREATKAWHKICTPPSVSRVPLATSPAPPKITASRSPTTSPCHTLSVCAPPQLQHESLPSRGGDQRQHTWLRKEGAQEVRRAAGTSEQHHA